MKNAAYPRRLIIGFSLAVLLNAPGGFGRRAAAMQITFVQAPANRNQEQTPQENREALPPEKKKSLSQFGPEDVFPQTEEQNQSRRQGSRRGAQTAPSPSPSPTPSATPNRSASPEATTAPAVAIPASAAPGPPDGATTGGGSLQQLTGTRNSTSADSPSNWALPVLSVLALIVSGALIYVLLKLRDKIREGSPG
jgi:hypothetical protein